jgi:hypothetical protein
MGRFQPTGLGGGCGGGEGGSSRDRSCVAAKVGVGLLRIVFDKMEPDLEAHMEAVLKTAMGSQLGWKRSRVYGGGEAQSRLFDLCSEAEWSGRDALEQDTNAIA